MSTLLIVLIVVGALLVGLALGGAYGQRRRLKATEGQWHVMVQQADRDLAAALAEDRGWEFGRLEAAARDAFTAANPDAAVEDIALIEVDDRPGTDEDRAAFRVLSGGRSHRVELKRRGDEWGPA